LAKWVNNEVEVDSMGGLTKFLEVLDIEHYISKSKDSSVII
jgi:hypothetical protein